jgi:hypothetical protein
VVGRLRWSHGISLISGLGSATEVVALNSCCFDWFWAGEGIRDLWNTRIIMDDIEIAVN